jgi:predicted ester cyclase
VRTELEKINFTEEEKMQTTEKNKEIVRRFNKEGVENGNEKVFDELLSKEFLDRSAPPGTPTGPEGIVYFITKILRPAIPDIAVEIHDQIAEGDKVTTRKTFHGTHQGTFVGIPATGRRVSIDVVDIVRLRDGQYVEHWVASNFSEVLAQLSFKQ